MTHHEQVMMMLDYAPDSEQLLSCSSDCVQLWYRHHEGAGLEAGLAESRGPGAMDEAAERTLRFPQGTALRIAKVHPAWTSVLLATNEALEVRELRRNNAGHSPLSGRLGERAASSSEQPRDLQAPLALKWRRQNIQVTAAAFISHGNMLIVSDRGDRLLILNYHGLQAAKRCVLPWADPERPLPPPASAVSLTGGGSPGGALDPHTDADTDHLLDAPGLGGARGHGGGGDLDSGEMRTRGVCTVTSIVECPDVARAEEWRSGVSHLAVGSSRGDVILIKL